MVILLIFLQLIKINLNKSLLVRALKKSSLAQCPYFFTNSLNKNYKLIIHTMSYPKFFKDLKLLFNYRSEKEKDKDYLGINPIIIFNGLSKGNIIHLFKLHNINLNGGSISRRHKLSITEYRLSIFIDLIDLFQENKEEFLYFYKENSHQMNRDCERNHFRSTLNSTPCNLNMF